MMASKTKPARKGAAAADLRAAILELQDLPRERMEMKEWGGVVVYVRSLNAAERDTAETAIIKAGVGKKPEAEGHWKARWLVACCVDAEGAAIFTEADVPRLVEKNGRAVSRLFTVADRLNYITGSMVEALRGN